MNRSLFSRIIAFILAAVMLFVSVSCTAQGNTNNSSNGAQLENTNSTLNNAYQGNSNDPANNTQHQENSAQNTSEAPGSIIIEYDDWSYDPPVTHEPSNILNRGALDYNDPGEWPVEISGLKDTAVQDRINAAIASEYARLSDPSYLPDVTGIKILQDKFDAPFIYSMVEGNVYNILSVACIYNRSYSRYYEGFGYYRYNNIGDRSYLNFDLRTGELITLDDIFIDGVDPEKYVNSRLIQELFDDMGANDLSGNSLFSLISPFKGIRKDQPFYISENGDLVICIDNRNKEFFLSNGPVVFSIDISKVSALESRFGQTEGLYEGGTEYLLRTHELEGGYSKLSLDIYPEILNVSHNFIYSDVDIRQYDALSRRQNEFLAFADMGLEKLAAQINSDYDNNAKQDDEEYAFAVQAGSSASCQGEYIKTSRHLIEYDNRNDNSDVFLSFYEKRLYKQGSDEPLKVSDLFVPGSDWKALVKNAALKRLERENYYSFIDTSDPDISDLYDYLTDNIDETGGYTVYSEYICFDYDYSELQEAAARLQKNNSLRDMASFIAENFFQVYFKDIGYENLAAFAAD